MDQRDRLRLTRRQFLGSSITAMAGLAALGCVPASGPSRTGAPVPTDRSAELVVHVATGAIEQGLPEIEGIYARTSPELLGIAHASLSQPDHDANVIPVLAERLPSVEDGTWIVNPDGTMQATWHLRRNVRWHDGHPFTAHDVRFSWEFVNDRSIPFLRRPLHTDITAIDVPDDYTAVMHWKLANPYAILLTTTDLFLYPQHILRPLWQPGEGERLLSHGFFHDEFIGLGAFRMERRNPDDSFVFKAFNDYFLGRPRIGTIEFLQFDNSQAVLTRLLAGELHMTTAFGLDFQNGVTAQEQWESRGEGKVHWTPTSLQRLVLPPDNPLFRDVRVRKALLHAIDRDEMNRTLFRGNVHVAHSVLHPNEAGYRAADSVISKYRYDPREALALLNGAGWQRSSEGVLMNAAGERFEVAYRAPVSDQEELHVQGAIANYWKDIGVQTTFENVTANLFSDRVERAKFAGVSVQGGSTTISSLLRRWHSRFVPTADTNHVGDNIARWSNPQADRLLEEVDRAIDPSRRESILVELATVFTDDLPALPLYYRAEPVAISNRLMNARPRPNSSGQNSTTWDAYKWELAGG